MATPDSSIQKMTAEHSETRNSPPDSTMDHDIDLKAKEHTAEYVESAISPEDAEFKRKEKALVRKLDLFIAPVM
jgi:hypothetical protein